MILKFRESTISRLERLRKREKEGPEGQEDEKDREIVSVNCSLFIHPYHFFFFTYEKRTVLQSSFVTNYAILLLCESADRAEKRNTISRYKDANVSSLFILPACRECHGKKRLR